MRPCIASKGPVGQGELPHSGALREPAIPIDPTG